MSASPPGQSDRRLVGLKRLLARREHELAKVRAELSKLRAELETRPAEPPANGAAHHAPLPPLPPDPPAAPDPLKWPAPVRVGAALLDRLGLRRGPTPFISSSAEFLPEAHALQGFLDTPGGGAVEVAEHQPFEIAGWLVGRGVTIQSLRVVIGGRLERSLTHGLVRSDVVRTLRGVPHADRSGFFGRVRLDGLPPDEWFDATIIAVLTSGERVRCWSFRVRAVRGEEAPQALSRPVADPRESWHTLLAKMARAGGPDLRADEDALFERLAGDYQERGDGALLDRDLEAAAHDPPRLAAPETRPPDGRRLKLLVVSSSFPSVEHAGGLAMFDILGELTKRHEVDLYSVYRDSLDRASLAMLKPKLGAVRLWSSTWMEPDDARAWMAERRLAPGHYDAVHFFYPGSAQLIPTLGRYARRRVFTLQECTTRSAAIAVGRAMAEQPERAGEAARALVANLLVERGALLGCDHAIALTDGDAEFAMRVLGVERPTVIPTGISEHAVLAPLRAHGPQRDAQIVPQSVAFLGYYDHPPNVDAMLWYLERVHPLVRTRLPGYRFAVIGAGDLTPLQRRFGGDPTIDFVGRVDEIAGPLLRAQVCVAPLVSGAGFRGKINQYSAAGRPAVATSLAADGLGYSDGESILIADYHDLFAEQLVRLLADGPLWQRIRLGAEQAIEPFRWPRLIERYEALYR